MRSDTHTIPAPRGLWIGRWAVDIQRPRLGVGLCLLAEAVGFLPRNPNEIAQGPPGDSTLYQIWHTLPAALLCTSCTLEVTGLMHLGTQPRALLQLLAPCNHWSRHACVSAILPCLWHTEQRPSRTRMRTGTRMHARVHASVSSRGILLWWCVAKQHCYCPGQE